eukprot:9456097-Pyramimonas_sp.AAC.1
MSGVSRGPTMGALASQLSHAGRVGWDSGPGCLDYGCDYFDYFDYHHYYYYFHYDDYYIYCHWHHQ